MTEPKEKGKRWRRTHQVGHQATGEVLSCLTVGSVSFAELAEASGLNKLVVGHMLRAWRASKVVYISGWDTNSYGRCVVSLWSFGNKPDVPRPKPTREAINRQNKAWRERVKLVKQLNLSASPPLAIEPLTEIQS